jgi:WD40 repeat protein
MKTIQSESTETSPSVVACLLGNSVHIWSIDRPDDFFVIRREVKLTCLDLTYDETKGVQMAVGDDKGKIFHILNVIDSSGKRGQLIVKTLHWHSHAVASLKFLENTPYLLSAGTEAVVVQWHLEKQDRTFVSRLGEKVSNLALSQRYGISTSTFFAAILADNTLKVVRIDNNKTVLTCNKPQFEGVDI